MQGLVGHRDDLGFYCKRGGSPGGPWAEEGSEPDSGAHGRPLVAAAGRTDCGDEDGSPGTRVQLTALVHVGAEEGREVGGFCTVF